METATYSPEVPNFPTGCHICEVEIDPETGKTEMLRYTVVDDVGTVINKLTLEGQIHGGIGQGVGQAFIEHMRLRPGDGPAPHRLVPRLRHAARRRHVLFDMENHPVPTKTNPLGVKGAGEAGNVGALAAIMNAVGRRAVAARRRPYRHAGDAGARLARHPRGARRRRIGRRGFLSHLS